MLKRLRKYSKSISLSLVLTLLFNISLPTTTLALTGGTIQEEYASFESVNSSEMVDLFTGDFKYNIPLLDIGGYPINIFYDANVSMGQESSWMGLGWNINAGSLNRNMRGLPDDFKGDQVNQTLKMKPMEISSTGKGFRISTGAGASVPIGPTPVTLSANVQTVIQFTGGKGNNNYSSVPKAIEGSLFYGKSFSAGVSVGVGIASVGAEVGISRNFSLSYSGYSGMTFGSSVNVYAEANATLLGASVGAQANAGASAVLNTRKGLVSVGVSSGYNLSSSFLSISKKSNGKTTTNEIQVSSRSYSPGLKYSMSQSSNSIKKTFFVSADIGIGFDDGIGVNINGQFDAIREDNKKSKSDFLNKNNNIEAFGYYYAEKSNNRKDILQDFNRLNDEGQISENSYILPTSYSTSDFFIANGQGVGMAFKTSRSDVGNSYDNLAKIVVGSEGNSITEKSDGVSVNLNLKGIFKDRKKIKKLGIGYTNIDVEGTTLIDNHSTYWEGVDGQISSKTFNYIDARTYLPEWLNYEPSYFEVIGGTIKNSLEFEKYYGGIDDIVRYKVSNNDYQIVLEDKMMSYNKKTKTQSEINLQGKQAYIKDQQRNRRNQLVENLTRGESKKISNSDFIEYFNIGNKRLINGMLTPSSLIDKSSLPGFDHHFAEFTVLGNGGDRYVYAMPSYSKSQKENLMSIPTQSLIDKVYDIEVDQTTNSISNNNDKAKYFTSKNIPAYASSFLLTATTSSDYVDLTGDGFSTDDLGDFKKFNYYNAGDYSWRSTVGKDGKNATAVAGAYSDDSDDMAFFAAGTREQKYLHSIETKEYIAFFNLEERYDGYEVDDQGKPKLNAPNKSMLLRSIELFSKNDLTTPIKVVTFEYDYSLCKNIPNAKIAPNHTQTGKLTLKAIYFSTGKSKRSALNPYRFTYSNKNPDYNQNAVDRWGNFNSDFVDQSNDMKSFKREFPYACQTESIIDQDVKAWTLEKITMPSGGEMKVDFESDDYEHVNDSKPQQMYQVVGVSNSNVWTGDLGDKYGDVYNESYLNIKVNKEITTEILREELRSLPQFDNKYWMFFKGFVYLKNQSKKELQSFYVPIDIENSFVFSSSRVQSKVMVKLLRTPLRDGRIAEKVGKEEKISYISWLTMQNTRNYYSEQVYGVGNTARDVFDEFLAFFKGINKRLYDWKVGKYIDLPNAYVRLPLLETKKFGGGKRVHQIKVIDNWGAMNSGEETLELGQEYTYKEGVLNYEIANGSEDRNKKPAFYINNYTMAPDELLYNEVPSLDDLYPSGQIGYKTVSVKNIYDANAFLNNKEGEVEYNFYTTVDFPYYCYQTDIEKRMPKAEIYSTSKSSSSNLFVWSKSVSQNVSFDIRAAGMSQGFMVRLNKMHGQIKEIKQYDANHKLMSGVKYYYKTSTEDSKILDNNVPMMDKYNSIVEDRRLLFVETDALNDSRSNIDNSTTKIYTHQQYIGSGNLIEVVGDLIGQTFKRVVKKQEFDWSEIGTITNNTDISNQINEFYSNSFTKIINQSGILVRTEVYDVMNNTKNITENLLWDVETGEVLLQKSQNQYYNDSSPRNGSEYYSFSYPAHWTDKNMGGAYQNYGIVFNSAFQANGKIKNDYLKLVFPGDKLMKMTKNSLGEYVPSKTVYWIAKDEQSTASSDELYLIDRSGAKVTQITSNDYFKVIKSGAANLTSVSMGNIVSLKNPLVGNSIDFNNKDVISSVAYTYNDRAKMPLSQIHQIPSNILVPTAFGNEIFSLIKYLKQNEYGDINSNSYVGIQGFPDLSPYLAGPTYDPAPMCQRIKTTYDFINLSPILKSYLMNCSSSNDICAVSKYTLVEGNNSIPTYIDFKTNTGRNPVISSTTIDNNSYSEQMALIKNKAKVLKSSTINKPQLPDSHTPDTYVTPCRDGIAIDWNNWGAIKFNSTPIFNELMNQSNQIVGEVVFKPAPVDFTGIPNFKKFVIQFNFYDSQNVLQSRELDAEYISYDTYDSDLWRSEGISLDVNLTNCPLNIGDVVNPYVYGLRGNWHLDKTYVYKDGLRINSDGNYSLNGVYDSQFTPYWTFNGAKWVQNPSKYQQSGEITIMDNNGNPRESKNLNEVYSAILMGYNNRLPIAQAVNAQVRDIVSENFEEYRLNGFDACLHGRLDFSRFTSNLTNQYAHTGNYSLKIDNSAVTNVARPILPIQEDGVADHGVPFVLTAQDNLLCFSPRTLLKQKYILSYWQSTVNKVEKNGKSFDIASEENSNNLLFKVFIDGLELPVISTKRSAIIDGWQKVDVIFEVPNLQSNSKRIDLAWATQGGFNKSENSSINTEFYLDDIRIKPFGGALQTVVYDPIYLRKVASLDDNNFATFFEYDDQGNLIRIKQESAKGISTVQETQSGLIK